MFPFYIYIGGPIDTFACALTEDEVAGIIDNHLVGYTFCEDNHDDQYDHEGPLASLFADVATYMRFFTDNILREPIRVFAIPGDMGMDYAFIAKLDNNGTTYIFSPHPLAYLENFGFELDREPTK